MNSLVAHELARLTHHVESHNITTTLEVLHRFIGVGHSGKFALHVGYRLLIVGSRPKAETQINVAKIASDTMTN
jgi:hypothetical protein